MSRLENTGKNAVFSTVANLLYTLMGVLGRYAFLMVLDETYLGISSLFYSIVGALAFANLGFDAAFSFCFYKPIAENDIPHIQSLLRAFKYVMYGVVGVILGIGLALIPFLRVLVKGGDNISDTMLVVYYLISLANTVVTYFMVYKTVYVSACQKGYKLIPFNVAANFAVVILQILVLFVFKEYAIWASCTVVVTAVQCVVISRYIKREFPETSFEHAAPIPEEDKKSILRNIKAAVVHGIGDVCVNQTDSIIVSSMVGIATTGLLSNYEMIKNAIVPIVNIIQRSVIPGLGNLIACEDEKVQKNVLYTYMMINYLLMGFAMCGIGILSSPFIALVFGADKIVDELTITLMCVGFYVAYQTHALSVFPTAAGKLILGAWVAVVEGISNLIISLAAVKVMGLPGVYFGTVASQVINYIIRPFSIFKGIYNEKPYQYFRNTILYFASSMLSYGILWVLRARILGAAVTVWNFAVLTVLTPVVFFGTAWLLWGRTRYGREAMGVIRQAVNMFLKRNR